MTRVVLLALVSCLGSSVIVGAVRYFTRAQMPFAESVRVAVFTRNHADGAALAADELREELVPGDLVSAEWLSPEAAAAYVGKPCLVASAGSALTASHCADLTMNERIAACAKAVSSSEPTSPEVENVFAAFQPKAEPAREVPKGRVLFLARTLNAGDALKAGDLRAGEAPAELVTASWISAERSGELVGQQVLMKLEEGSPLWWQMVNVPGTARSCEFDVNRALETAHKRTATAWVTKESASW